MFPILTSKHHPYKATLSPPTSSPESATGAMAFSMSFPYSDLSASLSTTSTTSIPSPPPPPPTPNDMLDITPRKCSFSSSTPRTNNTCAFPSWPNRPSLINSDPTGFESSANSHLSDEDLLLPVSPDEESAAALPAVSTAAPGPVLTTEQQIQAIKAAADDEEWCRARFLAQVQAHARVHQNRRLTTTTTTTAQMEREIRPKRRSRSGKKRPRLGSNRG